MRKPNPLLKLAAVPTILACFLSGAIQSPVEAVEDLSLAPGISFTMDTGKIFPLTGTNLGDAHIEPGKPAVIFFAAAGDLNCNRQARRLVDLYKQNKDRAVKFIVVDVDNPSGDQARSLIQQYYPGYVPAQLMLDKDGKVVWSHIGEVTRRQLRTNIGKMM